MLTVIPHRSRTVSAIFPVTSNGVTSTSIRWLSVPPLISCNPPACNTSASVLALSMIARA